MAVEKCSFNSRKYYHELVTILHVLVEMEIEIVEKRLKRQHILMNSSFENPVR